MRLYVSCLLVALVTALLIPISASAQADAECVAIYDADGTRVARASLFQGGTGANAYAVFDDNGLLATLVVNRDEIRGGAAVFFTGINCTGNAYMNRPDLLLPEAHLGGNVVWYPDTTATHTDITYASFKLAGTDSCTEGSNPLGDAVPAFTFTLPTFTPLFHLEPEACFTPPPGVAALTPYGLGALALVLVFGAYVMRKEHFATAQEIIP